ELADAAHQDRQVLRTHHDQRDGRDQHEFGGADAEIEHGWALSDSARADQAARARFGCEARPAAQPRASSFSRSDVSGFFSAVSASSLFSPSLKARMPLAASPMIEDSRPRPPNSSAMTTRTISQCQIENEPIGVELLQIAGPS